MTIIGQLEREFSQGIGAKVLVKADGPSKFRVLMPFESPCGDRFELEMRQSSNSAHHWFLTDRGSADIWHSTRCSENPNCPCAEVADAFGCGDWHGEFAVHFYWEEGQGGGTQTLLTPGQAIRLLATLMMAVVCLDPIQEAPRAVKEET